MHEEICRRLELKLAELKTVVLDGINRAHELTHEQMEIIDQQGQRYLKIYTQYIKLKRIIDGNNSNPNIRAGD